MEESIMFTIDSAYILVPALIIFLLYITYAALLRHKFSLGQAVLLTSFAIYFLCMIHLVFFPIEVNIGKYANLTPWYKSINFIPILTIDITTFLLNVIMMLPFGMYLPLLNKKYHSIKKAAYIGFLVSLTFEIIQLLIRVTLGNGRSTDINDLIANTLGAVVGFLLIKKLSHVQIVIRILHKISLEKGM
ncbi:VanZ family protein [Cytobacillus massiliigabonensis]|uniref:VanZ family protein n=1 Tax=Cytobacillus massiliigabonensis TaxID=1871011 RepID=UPI000C839664|nr:VanZ family protein [Cytobacillus massiliigabonensis]